jgi:hypothetical protein
MGFSHRPKVFFVSQKKEFPPALDGPRKNFFSVQRALHYEKKIFFIPRKKELKGGMSNPKLSFFMRE